LRATFITGGAGIDAIRVEEIAAPQPRAGEALVRMTAATLNFRDLIMAKGLIPGLTKQPAVVPLSCAAAEVVAVAEGVTRVNVGDRVSPLYGQGWLDGPVSPDAMLGGSVDGVARDLAAFDAESLVLLPDEVGDLEAATLPCAGLTAWTALFGARPLQPGEWILAQGTGGVSIAALQWAIAAGAHVAITSSSDAKLARARALGADVTVNYRTADWAAQVAAATGGVDIVIDVVGQNGLERSAALLNDDGVVAAIGMLDGPFSMALGEIGGKRVVPVNVGNRRQHEDMLAFAARHGVRPVVDKVFPLERIADAYRCLERGQFFGKVGVTFF
jgi:NADPH:quinone reductase-like Zn-dependent oxidoreductase